MRMIGSLRGTILDVHSTSALLEVQGIGFLVKGSIPFISSLKVGEQRFVYTHDHVREDARELFAFSTLEELHFFEKLISISGVGPKVALTILSAGSLETVRRSIMTGDLATLTSVPGVGTKTAQKIILELKGQLVNEDAAHGADQDVIDGLASLGYSVAQAREALKHVDASVTDVSARIREALRLLSK
jgi:Holliday junction DNA helicase RuvA